MPREGACNRLRGTNVATDWDRLVREQGPAVFGTAWRILRNAADAEEVVQDVFLEAHRMLQTRAIGRWGGLLRRIAVCRALDRLRQRKPILPLDGVSLACNTDSPEEEAIGHELADRLRQALSLLPERESTVFCLRYFEDFANAEIAESLGITAGAVAVAMHKARAKLELELTEVSKGETS
jgi:RNA polymerase sigma-70 factor, ECF subfamily